jgi:hypothetical protein
MLWNLPSQTFAAGGYTTILLGQLPKQVFGRIPHVRRFIFDVTYTPTTTALPTVVGNNNLVNRLDFHDGRIMRWTAGFNSLRAHERISTGNIRVPDADTDTASGTARYYRRVLHMGPPNMAGGLSDFMLPTGVLDAGYLGFTFGALTDLASDCTACTGTIKVAVELELMDEIRIPPSYNFQVINANSATVPIPGRALYCSLSAFKTTAYGNWTAGDLANIRLDFGQGDVVPSIPAEVLQAAYHDDFARGDWTFNGDTYAASDDNAKQVNHASPTAIAAAQNDLAMFWWTRDKQKLTKLQLAESFATLYWSGAATAALVNVARILPQGPSVLTAYTNAALAAIKRSPAGSPKFKPLSKKDYTGPFREFFPVVQKVGKAA